jgi:DNA-binding winged helix-turn-helix (wHTH) protein
VDAQWRLRRLRGKVGGGAAVDFRRVLEESSRRLGIRMNVRFGVFVLDRGRRELRRGEDAVALTPKAFQLLDLLLEKRPSAVAKGEVYERLWPSTFVSEVNLSRLVCEVRSALGDDSRRPRWIRTLRGFGYAFAGAAEDEPIPGPRGGESGWCRVILKDRELVLSEGPNVLGRSHRAAVFLDSTSVSRGHARIVVAGRQATLEDLGSKNGTFWRGSRIAAAVRLSDGDAIRVGSVPMTFRIVPPEGSTDTLG